MKRRKRKHTHKPAGTPPGVILPAPDAPAPVIRVMAYGPEQFTEEAVTHLSQIQNILKQHPVLWLDVDGLGDAETIRRIGEIFHLHPLALEDATHTHQRAKVDRYDEHVFIVARMLCRGNGGQDTPDTEQLSIFLGRGFVITFQEGVPGDKFGPIRDRIRKTGGRFRQLGADYLAYALLDALVDAYFPVLESLGDRLDALEDQILAHPGRRTVSALYEAKRELLTVRRALWPLREAMNQLVRDEGPLITPDTRLHLRDCYDHVVRLIEFVETSRELAADLVDLYLSSVSQRTNDIMRVLTIIATIFIPLTYISSIYGMNFDTRRSRWNMPELEWAYGYPFVMGVMALVAVAMIAYFWRKGWLTGAGTEADPPNPPADRHGQ